MVPRGHQPSRWYRGTRGGTNSFTARVPVCRHLRGTGVIRTARVAGHIFGAWKCVEQSEGSREMAVVPAGAALDWDVTLRVVAIAALLLVVVEGQIESVER